MTTKEAIDKIQILKQNLEKAIKDKGSVLELAIATLLARGHLLIEDVPGVGKTTLAHSLALSIDASFQRVQFTSDLMPSDIVGISIYNDSTRNFEFRKGPIFANVVLADEINRATPKTQSALLEAMSEGQVSVDNITHRLPNPFMILATQNPLEYAGTFPLPESQLDRFTISTRIGYPSEEVERQIASNTTTRPLQERISPVVSSQEVIDMQDVALTVKIEDDLLAYIVKICSATRTNPDIKLGVSPRATIAFYRSAQAMALIAGRDFCTPDDIKKVAVPCLAHRIMQTRHAMEDSIKEPALLIEEIVEGISVPV
jgi:MoxR-like ATPase